MTTQTQEQNLIMQLQSQRRSLPDYDLPWLRDTRREGLARFEQLGFPRRDKGRRAEHWKYTDTHSIANSHFWQGTLPAGHVDEHVVEKLDVFASQNVEVNRLVFINGRYIESMSRLPDLQPDARDNGLIIEDLTSAFEIHPEMLSKHLSKLTDETKFPFAAINTGLLEQGALISIPDQVELQHPIYLLFLNMPCEDPASGQFSANPRILVIGGASSRFDLIEHYHSIPSARNRSNTDTGTSLTNVVSEIFLHANSHCRYVKLQQENEFSTNIGATCVRQDKESEFVSYAVSFGGALVRNDLNVSLCGERAECALHGLYALHNREHIDHHTCIDHIAPLCRSREYYKGLIDDLAHAVFNGRIHIHAGAQQTDAALQNKNLLLSNQAEVDTKPELEIYADDVRCAHGATVGELDADQIHYLATRGIDPQQARTMLSTAFINEIIESLPFEALRNSVLEQLADRTAKGRIET